MPIKLSTSARAVLVLLLAVAPARLGAQDVDVLPWGATEGPAADEAAERTEEAAAFLEDFRVLVDFAVADLDARLDTLPTADGPAPGFTGWEVALTRDSVVRVRVGAAAFPAGGGSREGDLCEAARGLVATLEIGTLRGTRGRGAIRGFAVAFFEAPDSLAAVGDARSPGGGTVPDGTSDRGVPADAPKLAQTADERTITCGARRIRLPDRQRIRQEAGGGSASPGS